MPGISGPLLELALEPCSDLPSCSATPHYHGRYQGHVPSVAFAFGSPYGTATLKYFQDQRNAALEKSHTPFSTGGHFPTLFSSNPDLVLSKRSHTRDRWLHTPVYTRFNLDSDRSTQLAGFYQVGCPGLGGCLLSLVVGGRGLEQRWGQRRRCFLFLS